ncbi:MAG: HIRAN domain-containing protein [Nitrospira sp.]|nr:HIRAN domain-containing protein [bacterium]MBL7048499.1 HIRAN domain-containing protein [Nitrospira sp.]
MTNRRNILKSFLFIPAAMLLPSSLRKKPTSHARLIPFLETNLAGFKYYRGSEISDRIRTGDRLSLLREPSNPYDYDAVQVFRGRDKLGYIPRTDSSTVAQMMDRGVQLTARIQRISGADDQDKEIYLEVEMQV